MRAVNPTHGSGDRWVTGRLPGVKVPSNRREQSSIHRISLKIAFFRRFQSENVA
jgi:hypothetical protein